MSDNDSDLMNTDEPQSESDAWRTPTAIAIAAAIGIPFGVFLYGAAAPFGPIFYGWFVVLAMAILVGGGLSIMATNRYVLVGFGYAAGVAAATVVARLVYPRSDVEWLDLPVQFVIILAIVSVASLPGSGLVALLKWEDQRAREKERK